ncbi:MAG TPA: phage portal protein [Candidatus Onthousia faecavium]|nr:phage portal protein [Candidatus Onthousia faecavium]
MAKERRSFFDKLLNGKNNNLVQKTLLKLVSGFNASFSTVNKNITLNDTVAICVDTIAKHCAKFEPRHYKIVNGQRVYINGDINYLLSNQPNPVMTTYDFIYRIISLLYLQNNVFVYIDKDDKGFIIGFYPINYSTAEWQKDFDNNLYLKFWLSNGKCYILPYGDLIHLRRFYNDDDLIGSSNRALMPALQNQVTAEEGISNAIKVSNSLRGVLKFTQNLKDEDIEKNKKRFVDSFINSTDNDGIAAIDNKTDFKELNIKPITLDKDQLEHVDQRVLNYFNLNKSIISGDFTPTQWNAFYETVLEPLAIYLEQSFKMKIFSKKAVKEGNSISFSVNRVQYASLEEKVKLVKEVGAMGLLTVDQALMILDLAPIGGEEGKKRMQSLNYINAEIADVYQLSRRIKDGDDNND